MFLCRPCHKKVAKRCTYCEMKFRGETAGLGLSEGPCEECGKVRLCTDCHA